MLKHPHFLLVAVASATLAACGFGDDSGQQGDDGDDGDDAVEFVCGDGGVDPGEDCDDGDTTSGDGCSANCGVEAGWSCTGEPSVCTMATGSCGDGAVSTGENCDDGAMVSNDGCSMFCQVEPGWECSGAPSTCNRTCGNGTVAGGEECDDGDTTGGDGCSAVCEIEAGWTCSGSPSTCMPIAAACGLAPQSGCPGMACDLTPAEDGTTACRAVTGNGVSDSFCPVDTICLAGYTCVGETPSTSYCMRFCVTDGGCNGNSRCLNGLVSDAGVPIPGVTVCTNSCSPMTQTGCPAGLGLGCLGFNATGGDFTDCEVMGTKVDGATCAESTECQPGSLCAGVGGDPAICRSYCRVLGTNTCGASSSCLGFVNPLMIAGEELGACD